MRDIVTRHTDVECDVDDCEGIMECVELAPSKLDGKLTPFHTIAHTARTRQRPRSRAGRRETLRLVGS